MNEVLEVSKRSNISQEEIKNNIKKKLMALAEGSIDEILDKIIAKSIEDNTDISRLIKTDLEIVNNTNIPLVIHILERGTKENGFKDKIELLTEEECKDRRYFYNEERFKIGAISKKESSIDLKFVSLFD